MSGCLDPQHDWRVIIGLPHIVALVAVFFWAGYVGPRPATLVCVYVGTFLLVLLALALTCLSMVMRSTAQSTPEQMEATGGAPQPVKDEIADSRGRRARAGHHHDI